MMQKRQFLMNAALSVTNVIVIGVILFILYRFLIKTIGIEQLGIWSVVLASTSIFQIANLGISAGSVKFVAKYLARGDEDAVAEVIQTSAVSLALLISLLLVIVYPLAGWLLHWVVPEDNLKDALSILPYALTSLWIMVIAGVFQAGLDGYQRIDLRNILVMGSALIHLILCIVLVPKYGLMALAYAQVIQSSLLLIGSWLVLKRQLPLLPVIPYRWSRKLFRELVGYGLNFQIISISQMVYDPVTKALLTKFGGLALTGFYEMANRMVLQLRALVVAANQVLVPTIADLEERQQEMIQKVYRDSYRLLLYVSLPMFSAIIAFAPIVSLVWIGHYEMIFVVFSTMLAVGYFLNTLNAPAYFINLGIGQLRWNTIAHVMIGVMNLVLGYILGHLYGGVAVVAAWVVSLVTGSLLIPISYHYTHKIPLGELLPRESIGVGLSSIAGLAASLLSYYQLNDRSSLLVSALIAVLVYFAIISIPLLQHPMLNRLRGWITYEFFIKAR